MFIPSNFSTDEILQYGDIPQPIAELIDSLYTEINELQNALNSSKKRLEIVEEQVYFRNEFIGEVKHILNTRTTFKQSKTDILAALANSYIEL